MEKEKENYKNLEANENASIEESKKKSSTLLEEDSNKVEKSDNFVEDKNSSKEKKEYNSEVSKKKNFSSRGLEKDKKFPKHHFQNETLETKRVVKVTKGGRRFSFTRLILLKDEEKKSIAFAYSGGKKDTITASRKSFRQSQRKLISYFAPPRRTIPHDIILKYKATKLFLKPTPPGSGIKAGGVLNKLFKFLEIKDVSAKIIGSRNKLNVIQTAFRVLDKLTHKKYDY